VKGVRIPCECLAVSILGLVHFRLQRTLSGQIPGFFLRDIIFIHSRWRRKIAANDLLEGIFGHFPVEQILEGGFTGDGF